MDVGGTTGANSVNHSKSKVTRVLDGNDNIEREKPSKVPYIS